jgi:hypothetical protein
MHFVRSAEYAGDYKLKLGFEDGSIRLVDLRPHLAGEVFEPLRDAGYFRNFSVNEDLDTVTWENGADFSPDFLYEIGEVVAESA